MTTPAGLQAERTALAWSRTTLALLADGGLLLHSPLHGALRPLLAALALALAGGTAVLARRRGSQLRSSPYTPDAYGARRVTALGAAVALLALGVGASALRQ